MKLAGTIFHIVNRSYVGDLRVFFGLTGLLSNWWLYYLDYLNIFSQQELLYRLRNNIRFFGVCGNCDGLILKEIWLDNIYTPNQFSIGENDIVVDIGAHKGYFAIFASQKAKKGQVHAFEPMRDNLDFLKRNITINKSKNIKSYELAISGKKEKKSFFINNMMARIAPMYSENKKVSFNCITLSDIFLTCKIKHIDFLKIDCEGAEYDILLTTPSKIFKKINKISLEYHQISGNTYLPIVKLLKKNGFSIKLLQSYDKEIGMMYAKNRSWNK